MNLQQFSALKEGDEVQNVMSGSFGTVTKADREGVHVGWGGNARTFHYTVASTAWFHWEKASGDTRTPRPVDRGSGGNV